MVTLRNPIVTASQRGRIRLILCDNPPVNAIGHGLRQGLFMQIAAAKNSDEVDAIIIGCSGPAFFAGADISEFSSEELPPTADSLIELIEASHKPVIAAMHGRALGGGLELALACHYRVAAIGTVFGFPEVTLGLIPGLGGTQRFPRIVGFAEALKLVSTGENIGTQSAERIGLLDLVTSKETFFDEAVAFAAELHASPDQLFGRLAANRDEHVKLARCDRSLFREARLHLARRYRGLTAPLAAVDAVEAALDLPFAQALANERRIFYERMASGESASLTRLFFAEREARKHPLAQSEPAAIRTVGIVGGGTMGRGILIAVLEAGYNAVLIERDTGPAEACIEAIQAHFRRRTGKGDLTEVDAAAMLQRVSASSDWSRLRGCELVIEAVFERLEIKRDVFQQISKAAQPSAILATNTSGLSVARIAEVVNRPQNVLGLHFFSPANLMKLLEIVAAPSTGGGTLSTALAFAKRLGKVAVVAKDAEGFIGNRMFDRYWREAELFVEAGISPYAVDAALEGFGMAMGPFAVSDLAGLDIGHDIRMSQPHPIGTRVPVMEERLYQAGRLGRKSGAGWYDYPEGKRTRSVAVIELLGQPQDAESASPTDIVLLCMTALVAEAYRILAEGVASRASDIDLVAVHGYGFPKFVGGPLHWFDTTGAELVRSWHLRSRHPVVDEALTLHAAGRLLSANSGVST